MLDLLVLVVRTLIVLGLRSCPGWRFEITIPRKHQFIRNELLVGVSHFTFSEARGERNLFDLLKEQSGFVFSHHIYQKSKQVFISWHDPHLLWRLSTSQYHPALLIFLFDAQKALKMGSNLGMRAEEGQPGIITSCNAGESSLYTQFGSQFLEGLAEVSQCGLQQLGGETRNEDSTIQMGVAELQLAWCGLQIWGDQLDKSYFLEGREYLLRGY